MKDEIFVGANPFFLLYSGSLWMVLTWVCWVLPMVTLVASRPRTRTRIAVSPWQEAWRSFVALPHEPLAPQRRCAGCARPKLPPDQFPSDPLRAREKWARAHFNTLSAIA